MNATHTDDHRSQIIDALRFVPADDREIWVRTAMAIKSELGDAGFSIWNDWSSTAGNYNKTAARDVWRSIKPGTVQIGTLFYIAKAHGYRQASRSSAPGIPEKKAPPPRQGNTGKYAAEIWLKADCSDDAVASHEYAIAKGISHAGGAGRATASGRVIGRDADCIIIPIRNIETGKVVAVQCINPDGKKQTFGPVSGHGLVLGNTLGKSLYWCIAEGWATGVSMVFHHLNGNGVAGIAFGKSNMNVLARKVADIYKPEKIRVLGEYDD